MSPTDPETDLLSPQDIWEIMRPTRVESSRGGPAIDSACADYLILHPLLTLSEWEALMGELIPTQAHADGDGSHRIGVTRVGLRMRADETRGVITFPCGFVEFQNWARSCHIDLPSVLVAGIGEAKEYAREVTASPLLSKFLDDPTPPSTKLSQMGIDENLNRRALATAKAMYAEDGLQPKKNAVAKRLSREIGIPATTIARRIRKTW